MTTERSSGISGPQDVAGLALWVAENYPRDDDQKSGTQLSSVVQTTSSNQLSESRRRRRFAGSDTKRAQPLTLLASKTENSTNPWGAGRSRYPRNVSRSKKLDEFESRNAVARSSDSKPTSSDSQAPDRGSDAFAKGHGSHHRRPSRSGAGIPSVPSSAQNPASQRIRSDLPQEHRSSYQPEDHSCSRMPEEASSDGEKESTRLCRCF